MQSVHLFKFVLVESTLLFGGEALEPTGVRGQRLRSGVQRVATPSGVQWEKPWAGVCEMLRLL